MTRPGGPPRGPEAGGAAAMSASRGGILIGVAVVVGILIFLVIGRGDPATVPATGGTTPGVTTPAGTTGGNGGTTATTVKGAKTTATTEAKKSTKAARANDQVVVQVLNGSGVQGAATQRSNDLKAKGYQVLPAGNAPSTRAGTAVQCHRLREGGRGAGRHAQRARRPLHRAATGQPPARRLRRLGELLRPARQVTPGPGAR